MKHVLYVGDLHIRGTNPRNRTDDYAIALYEKIAEVHQLAITHNVEAILCAGDIFDTAEVSISVLLRAVEQFRKAPVPWYTTPGNHDIFSYNLETYQRTSLRLLEMLVPQFHVILSPDHITKLGGADVTFTPFSAKVDVDGYGYSPEAVGSGVCKIHVAHGMLLDHVPPFDHYTLIKDVETKADLVLCGHEHTGFDVFKRADGVQFVNCGSLTRLTASRSDIERDIKVALISFSLEEPTPKVELIKLQSAAKGSEVLDRSRIEAAQERQYTMSNFAAKIETHTKGRALLDINDIIDVVASTESYAPEVVAKTKELIDQQRSL